MSRQHGKDCRVYLGARDASGDLTSITPEASADTHDTTVLGDDWRTCIAGLQDWSAALDAFYDPDAGGIGRQFETLLGAAGGILSIYDGDADAIGDSGSLYSDSVLEKRSQPISVGELVKLSGSLKGTGKVGWNAKLLHPLGQETITGTESSVDNGASSANGGRANLHITAITGTWTIVVEDSSDDGATDPWTTVANVGPGKTAIGATTLEITGTVKRYLRATHAEDVAGSVTYVLGFARY